MYIRITSRCQMTCAHCGFNCTHEGADMSVETFKACLDFSGESMIVLGGGEPTLNPHFWEILSIALGNPYVEDVWLATNGADTETAIRLAVMAKKGILGCDLSQDKFHDPIHHSVIDAFNDVRGDTQNDKRAIRNVTGHLIKAGRSKTGTVECFCPDLIIEPDGTVRACACEDAPVFGNVNTNVDIPDDWEWNTCHKEQL